ERHLLQAVERQLPGRAAAAILLSGGIDAMYLAALLARHFGVRTAAFTYRYADYEGEFNETARARATAEHLGLEHHEMIVGPADIAANLEAMLIAHSGPLSYGAHSAILRDVAASGAQILYSGFEPDAPYSSAAEMLGQWLRSVPLPHAAIARGVERGFGTRRRWANFLAYAERVAATGLVWRFHAPLTPDPIRESLYVDRALSERAKQAAARLFGEVVAEFSTENAVVRIAGPLTALYQSEGSSRWSSCFGRAHGLLPRSPFQDNDYVDLLLRMPRSGHKREIRELAAKLLPRDLAFAPKVAQTLPIAHWLRGPMSEFITAQLSAPRIAEGGLFRHEVIMDLLRRHREGPVSHAWTLWNVLVLTLWQEIVRREAGRLCQRRV
ncbi:MAG TPA: asparagine synthase C-terminal domain-containing protein, partial [Alphaproteobacteria bacterium]|nr:asparagine synthase C-terminal domain-containing protein [Alphaproteobacteria bacterium]